MTLKYWRPLLLGCSLFTIMSQRASTAELRLVKSFENPTIWDYHIFDRRFGLQRWAEGFVFLELTGPETQTLWFTDGTSKGTVPVLADRDFVFHVRSPLSGDRWPVWKRAELGDVLVFIADRALWSVRRDSGEPTLLATVGGCFSGSDPTCNERDNGNVQFVSTGERVYFTGVTAEHGRELWISDGSREGTHLVEDISPGKESTVFEYGEDGLSRNFWTGGHWLVFGVGKLREWISDGTAERTWSFSIGDIGREFLRWGGLRDDRLYYRAPGIGDPLSWVWWRTDGTPEGTGVLDVLPFRVGSECGPTGHVLLQEAGGTQLRVAESGAESIPAPAPLECCAGGWFVLEGEQDSGRHPLRLAHIEAESGAQHELATWDDARSLWHKCVSNRLVFVIEDGESGRRSLWSSDIGDVGTVKLLDLGDECWHSELRVRGEDTILISRCEFVEDNGIELWLTDGTTNGTGSADFLPPSESSFLDAGAIGSDFVVLAQSGEGGASSLWVVRTEPSPTFKRGDCNDDGTVDISDAVFNLGSLFLGDGVPDCDDACDSNDDGAVDISDVIATLGVLFLGNGVIPLPGRTDCGVDPTDDAIGCDGHASCTL